MAALDFTGVAGPVEWLDRVFKSAIEFGWSDLQVRLIRDQDIAVRVVVVVDHRQDRGAPSTGPATGTQL